MPEEELNQELKADELKDVAGGSAYMKLGDIKGTKMHEKKRGEKDSFTWEAASD